MVRKVSNESACNYTKFNNETFYCAIVSEKEQDTCDGENLIDNFTSNFIEYLS